jgi:hypothetical protein
MSCDHNQYQRAIYNDWRVSEAHQVPVTEQGEKLAEHRWRGFERGYIEGMRAAARLLEDMHKREKDGAANHNFYLVSANSVRERMNILYEKQTEMRMSRKQTDLCGND